MKAKTILLPLFTLAFSLMSFSAVAQGGRIEEKKEQIKSLKVAFITEELKLTPAEAEKFWPLFNAYDDKQQELRQQKLKSFLNRMDEGAIDKLSDKEASSFLTQMENTEEEIYQLRKKFTANLKSILPPVKILKLKKAEEDFNRKLLKQYREKFRNRGK
ncbi:sensor of ECF-type sigma factor [Flavobacterium sp.]|uniref:sensor of ECF-type sigma factor n=1 Tax=Flavobacterium sp. TaxID=239 RepID=UPI0039E4034B